MAKITAKETGTINNINIGGILMNEEKKTATEDEIDLMEIFKIFLPKNNY